MNFLAHARNHIHRPYVLAGTALPDWLTIAHRRQRLRERVLPERGGHHAAEDLLEGVRVHLEEDVWFHQSEAFEGLTAMMAASIRATVDDRRVRASVLAHILLEMLLDAELMRRDPALVDGYYRSLAHIDAHFVSHSVNRWLPRPVLHLERVIEVFRLATFMRSYADDAGVMWRLSQVTRRVRLPALPAELEALLPGFRAEVRAHADRLLQP